jgi:Ca-activated chloride channel family protein
MMKIFGVCILMVGGLWAGGAAAQENRLLRKGNELYEQQQYPAATEAYQKALEQNPASVTGLFNAGNALYRQKQLEQARKAMEQAARHAARPEQKAAAHYNLGNTYMAERKWQEAVDVYKQSLRLNPADADARYNLNYALQMLQQQQQNQQQQKQDQQKDNQQNQQQQNQQQQQQKQQQQNDPAQMSQQQADRLLDALQQEEQKVHEKLRKGQGRTQNPEKDW